VRARSETIRVRVTATEKAELQRRADADGVRFSEWTRRALLGEALEPPPKRGRPPKQPEAEVGEPVEVGGFEVPEHLRREIPPLVFRVDEVVLYEHPDWGPCRGRVLAVEGLSVLVRDLSEHGGNEWWPTVDVVREEG
jgi:hypothetical protein